MSSRNRQERKPYDAPIRRNDDSPLYKAVRRIQQRKANSASDAIARLKADKQTRQRKAAKLTAKACVGCGDTFIPATDPRETHCSWCDALENVNS